ncbi:MAG: cupin domain-containing protein [Candidatus Hatepunaea meridiana]|nr:cupin domain-containing protein [Candidatus Hatepunaea meridiana]
MTIQKINLAEKLSLFDDQWVPRIIGELNVQYIKLVKFKGIYDWHHHENEDELFLVVSGRFTLELRDENLEVMEGEFVIVPRGIDHRPVADKECHIMLFEPITTLNTGNVRTGRTLEELERI